MGFVSLRDAKRYTFRFSDRFRSHSFRNLSLLARRRNSNIKEEDRLQNADAVETIQRKSRLKTSAVNPGSLSEIQQQMPYGQRWAVLLQPTQSLKGVGKITADALSKIGIQTVADVLLHLPTDLIDRSKLFSVRELVDGEVATVSVKVRAVEKTPRMNVIKVKCEDATGDRLTITYFYGAPSTAHQSFPRLEKMYPIDQERLVSGKARWNSFSEGWEIHQPDIVTSIQNLHAVLRVEPKYPLTQGLSNNKLRSVVNTALMEIEDLNDWLDYRMATPHWGADWPAFGEAFLCIHNPQRPIDLLCTAPPRSRLAFDELVVTQLELIGSSKHTEVSAESNTKACIGDGELVRSLRSSLPFELTSTQEEALRVIAQDLSSSKRMCRLLQGDVGSGKTIVATLAMLQVVEAGLQCAMLAPTEILAQQHYNYLLQYSAKIHAACGREVKIGYLSGSVRGKARTAVLVAIAEGSVDIVVGTHSLLGLDDRDTTDATDAADFVADSVNSSPSTNPTYGFKRLGLLVVDEEQRFGVEQREALGNNSNVLYMSATPIPRSLMLVLYGDVAVSTLTDKPPQSRSVKTTILAASLATKLMDRIQMQVQNRTKIFWILPSIDSSRNSTQVTAIERFNALKEIVGDRVGLIHGRMSAASKAEVMAKFADPEGELCVLVATSIIEVGVDIPAASICIIENAEMFGLSQLHQIRGRIGRGVGGMLECHCVLLYNDSGDEMKPSLQRLKILEDTTDGFKIAEADLSMRGPGDVLGIRQSGIQSRLVSLKDHVHMIPYAFEVAQRIHRREIEGLEPSDERLSILSSIFRRDSRNTRSKRSGTIEAGQGDVQGVVRSVRRSQAMAPSACTRYVDLTTEPVVVVILDTETTGLDTSKARIIQLAAKVLGSTSEIFNAYINPGSPFSMSERVKEITGLDVEYLLDNGRSFEAVWQDFAQWLHTQRQLYEQVDGRWLGDQDQGLFLPRVVLMAHNGRTFDFPLLAAELKRHSIVQDTGCGDGVDSLGPYLTSTCGVECFVDTLQVLRDSKLWEGVEAEAEDQDAVEGEEIQQDGAGTVGPAEITIAKMPSRFNQVGLYEEIFGRKFDSAHNALADVLALEEILSVPFIGQRWKTVANHRQFRL